MSNSDNDGNITATPEAVNMLSEIMSNDNIDTDEGQTEAEDNSVTSENDVEEQSVDEQVVNEEDLLPEKFKNKDMKDVIKSYIELEKRFHQVSQEKNDLYKQAFDKLVSDKKSVDNVNQQVNVEEEQKKFKESLKTSIPDDFVDSMISNPEKAKENLVEAISKISETIAEKKLERAIKPIQQQIVQQEVTRKLNQFKQKYPDYQKYEKHIIDVFQRFPEIDDGSVSGLEKAYLLARTLAGNSISSSKNNIKKKLSAQMVNSSSTTNKPQQNSEDDFRARLLSVGKTIQGVY